MHLAALQLAENTVSSLAFTAVTRVESPRGRHVIAACPPQKIRQIPFLNHRPGLCHRESVIPQGRNSGSAEPSLDFSRAHSLRLLVVGDLVAINLAEAEISRFRMANRATHA